MRKHGFRSIFSLLLALMMVCSLLPTAAFAEGNLEPTDQVTEQPTDQPAGGEVQQPTEKKEDAPQGEQPATPPQTYTVTYTDGVDGEVIFDDVVYPNLTAGTQTPAFNTDGTNPTRGGYTFLGWEPALAETVAGDVTYTAKWEAVQVEPLPATNDSYGIAAYKGGHDTPQPSVDFDDEKNLGSGRTSMWVYVIYHANYPGAPADSTWTVRYNIRPKGDYTMSGDGFLSYSQCGRDGKGFNWAGYKSNDVWYSDKNCTTVVNSLKVKKDDIIHLYAGWTKSAPTTYNYSFTLNYDVNGGDENSKPASQPYTAEPSTEASLSHTFTISSTVPTREGYTFKGWSDTADGGVNYTAGGSYTMNATKDSPNPAATLYAVWEEITYTVTYTDGVDGEEIFDDVVYHNLKAGDSTPTFNGTPIRKGYTFAGWNPEVAPTVTGDRIYTATWEPALPGAIFGSFIMKCVTTPKPSHYLIERADIELAPLNEYTNSGVQKGESGDTPTYYFELTVDAEKYLSQYDTKAAPTVGDPIAHTICDGQQTHPVIRYDWNGTAWVQVNKPVVEVKCTPAPVTFTVTYTDGVENEEVFRDQSYTVESGKPTPAFSGTPTRKGYTFAGWQPTVAETVTENATYVAQWTKNAPAKPEGDELPDISVTVDCTNTSVTHPDKTYGLLNGCYTVIEPTLGENGAYGCAIEIDGQKYVEHYSGETDIGCAHSLVTVDTRSPYVYVYLKAMETDTGYQWSIDEEKGSSASVTFKAVCEIVPPARTFTVTYTDGVDSVEVFADQITENLELGAATPPFNGTPTRNGYTFAGWEPTVAATVTGDATYTALWMKNPAKPEGKDIPEISVIVDCVNGNANHADGKYGLITDYYTVTDPEPDNGVYSCTVKIDGQKYVEHYSKELNSKHSLDTMSPYVSVKLTGTATDAGYTWSVAVGSSSEVRFQAMCENVPPAQTFTVTYTDGVDSVEVFADQITENLELGAATPPFNGTPTREGYTFDGWEPEVASTVTGNATYVAQWTKNAPAKPTENDLAGIKVFVQCTNSGATHGDKRKEYGLIGTDGYYYVGNPTFLESDGKYHCTVNVNGERYVAKYSTDTGVQHTYMSVDTVYKYAYLTATWTDGGYVWSVDKDGSTVTFEARCETVPPAQTFTVTYKDGVAGKAFQDQSYTVPSGSATPAFNGTPYLAGYVFTGWTPAVATTVTANATYIATWKLDTNNNGKPDDEEERYTVTYTDGAGSKAFADQVYTGLLSGTSTPKFNGTPVRAGYYFIGWSPKLSATVTGSVTYTATWTTAYGGLDKVPKTGDNGLTLALSALLLFSFCGAAACVVSTKKRG